MSATDALRLAEEQSLERDIATYAISLTAQAKSDVTVLVSTTSLHAELRVGATASWVKDVQVVIPAGSAGGFGISDVTIRVLDLPVANGGVHTVKLFHECETEDSFFANVTATGWLLIEDNDVTEVVISPTELEVAEQTENEFLNGVEGFAGRVVAVEISLPSLPEDGDFVTVTLTVSAPISDNSTTSITDPSGALKPLLLGSLESCATGGNARGDLAVSCMRTSAFATFSLENKASKAITFWAPYDGVADTLRSFSLEVRIDSSSPAFDAMSINSIPVSVTDEDVVGMFVGRGSTPIDFFKEPFVAREGGGDPIELTVFLLSRPVDEVLCTIAETYVSGASHPDLSTMQQLDVRPTELSFLPASFEKPLTFFINGVKDGLADGDVTVFLEFVCTSAGDQQYSDNFNISATFVVPDTDTAGLRVLNSAGAAVSTLEVAEGETAPIAIRLLSKPFCAECSIELDLDVNPGPVVPSETSFAIIPSAWGLLFKLDLVAQEDSYSTGDLTQTITLFLTTTDQIYGALGNTTVEVRIKDNDVPALEWRPASMTLYEGRAPSSLEVRLTANPVSDIVSVGLKDTGVGGASAHGLVVAPTALNFGGTDAWNVWQTFNISKVQDDLQTGTVTTDVCLEVDSDDSAFGLLPQLDPARCTRVTLVDDELTDPVTTLVEPSDVETAVTLGGSAVSTGVTIPANGVSEAASITLKELPPSEVAAPVSLTGYQIMSKMTAFTPHGMSCRDCVIRLASFADTAENLVLLRAADEMSSEFNPIPDAKFSYVAVTSSEGVVVCDVVVQTFSVYVVAEMLPQVAVTAGVEALASYPENLEASPLFPALELSGVNPGTAFGEYGLFQVSLSLEKISSAAGGGNGGAQFNGTDDLAIEGGSGTEDPAAERYDDADDLAIDCMFAGRASNDTDNMGDETPECSGACAECEAALALLEGGDSPAELMWDAASQVLMLRPKPVSNTNTTQAALPASTYLAVLLGVVYRNPSDNPDPTTRRVTLGLVENHLGSNLRLDRLSVLTLDFGIEAVNDPPVVILSGTRLAYEEGSGEARIDPQLVVSDPESSAFASATVWISPKLEGESLSVAQQSDGDGVQWSLSTVEKENDAVLLTSGAGLMSRSDLQTSLRSVSFRSDNKRFETLERNISFTVNDGSMDSEAAVLSIGIVAKNDAPFFLSGLLNYFSTKEDEVVKFTSGVRDPELVPTTTEVVCQGQLGVITPLKRYCVPSGCESTTGECETCYFDFEYQPAKDKHGRDTFVLQASDGEAVSPMQAFEMTVSSVNDPPVVSNYTFYVNIGEERTGSSIHLQGSDPDGTDVAYYQIWDADPLWRLSDVSFINLPLVAGYETQVEGRPRGGPEITFLFPPSSDPPAAVHFAYRAFDEVGLVSNIGYVTVTIRTPKLSNDPPVALDGAIIPYEGQLFRGILNFTHPLGRYGVSSTFSIPEGACPRLGALWINDAGSGEFTYRPHPLIASHAGNTVDEFGFQVKLSGCPTCESSAMVSAEVYAQAHAPQPLCEGVASLITGSLGGASIPENVPMLLRCDDFITELIDDTTREWGKRAAAYLLDTFGSHDAGTMRELLLKAAGRGETQLKDMSMPATGPSVVDSISNAVGGRIAGVRALKSSLESLKGAGKGGSCVDATCDLGVSMACWERSTIEAPMYIGAQSKPRAIALTGWSPAASAPPSAVILSLPSIGILLRPVGNETVWPAYVVNETVPHPNVLLYEGAANRRGVPIDTFSFSLVDKKSGQSTPGVVEINVRCAPGFFVEDETTCAPCPAGYRNQPGVVDQPAGSCTACPPGTFSDLAGSTECTPCSVGTFQAQEGQPECISCPANSVTEGSAVSQDACICDKGYYGDPNNPLPDREDGCIRCRDLSWAREPANKGKLPMVVCDTIGLPIPLPLAGWWVNPEDREDVQQCRPREACLGWRTVEQVLEGGCGPTVDEPRYTGPICAECNDDYYRESSTNLCRRCPDNPWLAGLLICIILLLGAPFLMAMVKLQGGFGAINIALSFSQLISLFQRFEWRWPDELIQWMSWLGVVNLDLTLIKAECIADVTFVHKFAGMMSLPLIIAILLLGRVLLNRLHISARSTHLIERLKFILSSTGGAAPAPQTSPPGDSGGREQAKRIPHSERAKAAMYGVARWALLPLTDDQMEDMTSNALAAFYLSLSWTYFALTSTLADFFDCKDANGRWSLAFEPSTECWNFSNWSWWSYAFFPAICFVLLYTIGIFSFFAIMLYKHRALLRVRNAMLSLESRMRYRRMLGGVLKVGMGKTASSKDAENLKNEKEALKRYKAKELALRKQLGFLYKRYNDNWFYFECINLSRKAAIIGSRAFFKSPLEQNIICLIILIAYVCVLFHARPYDRSWLDQMDSFASIAGCTFIFCGLLFYADLLKSYQEETVIYFLQGLILVSFVVLAVFVIVDIGVVFREKLKAYRDKALVFIGFKSAHGDDDTKEHGRRVKYKGTWMDAGRANILEQVSPFAHTIFMGRLTEFLRDADNDGEAKAATFVERLLVLLRCKTGLMRLHGKRADLDTTLKCACPASHESKHDTPLRPRYLDHDRWCFQEVHADLSASEDVDPPVLARHHFNNMMAYFSTCHVWLPEQMRRWTILDCIKTEARSTLATSLIFAQSATERRENAELNAFCAEVMRDFAAPRAVRWALRQGRVLFQRRRVWPSPADSTYAQTEGPHAATPPPKIPRDIDAVWGRLADEQLDESEALARTAFKTLVGNDMKHKLAFFSAIEAEPEGHRACLELLADLGRAYQEDESPANEPHWYRQIMSLRATSKAMSTASASSSSGGGSRPAGLSLSRMFSVLLMFTMAAGAATQGLPCQCPALSSEDRSAVCDNMLTGGAPAEGDLCRSSVRTRDTHCETQEDTPMQGLLVSPYGVPELRCTPRMGSIEIDIENPVGDTYLFTYTPFNGEPLNTASSVDLFTFERPTEEEGSSELRLMTILLKGINDPPVAVADGSGFFVITFNFNDRKPTSEACWDSFTQECYDDGEGMIGEFEGSDPEGDVVNFFVTSQPPNAIACASGDVRGGGRINFPRRAADACLSLGISGKRFLYLPAPGTATDSFLASEETFQYLIMDDGGGVHHAGGRGTSTLGACGSVVITREYSTCSVELLPTKYSMDEDQEGGLIGRFKRSAIHPDLRPFVRFQIDEAPAMGRVEVMCEGEEVEDCATCGDVSLEGTKITRESCFLYSPFENQHGNDTFSFALSLASDVPTGEQEVCKVPGGVDLEVNIGTVEVLVRPVVDPPAPRSPPIVDVPMRIVAAPPPAPPPPPLAPGERVQAIDAPQLFGEFFPVEFEIFDPDLSGEDIVLQLSLARAINEGSFLYPELPPEEANGTDVPIDWSRPLHLELNVTNPAFPGGARPPEGSLSVTVRPANDTGIAKLVLWYQAPPLVFGGPLEEIEYFGWRASDPGLRGDIAKVQIQVLCSPGYHQSEPGICSLCLPGTFTSEYGYEQCELCRIGSSSSYGATGCNPCPLHSYAPLEGTYACIDCPSGSITNSTGSSRDTDCLCDVGFYGEAGGPCNICPNPGSVERELPKLDAPPPYVLGGNLNASDDSERAEAEALQMALTTERANDVDRRWTICEEVDLRWPLPAKGFWVNTRDTPVTTRLCVPTEACLALNSSKVDLVPEPGVNCKTGYGSDACSSCLEGYYRLYGDCLECPDNFGRTGLLIGLAVVFLYPLIRQVVTAAEALPTISITVSFAQILAFIGKWDLEWPASLRIVFRIFSFLNMNFEMAHPECQFDYGFLKKYLTLMFIPIVFLAILVARVLLAGLHMVVVSRIEGRLAAFVENNNRKLLISTAELWNPRGFATADDLFSASSAAFPNLDMHGSLTKGMLVDAKKQREINSALRELGEDEQVRRADDNDPIGILCTGEASRMGKHVLVSGEGADAQTMARRFVMAHYGSGCEDGGDDKKSFRDALDEYKNSLVGEFESGTCPPEAFWRSVLLLGIKNDPDIVARAPLSDTGFAWSDGMSVRCANPLYDSMPVAGESFELVVPDVAGKKKKAAASLTFRLRRFRRSVQIRTRDTAQAAGIFTLAVNPFYDLIAVLLESVEPIVHAMKVGPSKGRGRKAKAFARRLFQHATRRATLETWHAMIHKQCKIYIIFLHLGYVLFAAFSLDALDCVYNEGNDKYYLQKEPSILCYEGDEWDRLLPYAVVFNILYPLGIPVVFAVLLWTIRGHLEDPVVKRIMGPIYGRFKDKWYWFECIVLLRKQIIVAISIMFSSNDPNTELQRAIIGMAVSFAALLLQVFAKPYAKEQLSKLEVLSIGGHFFYIFAGIVFLADSINDEKNLANPDVEPRSVMSDGFRTAFNFGVLGLVLLQFATMMAWVAVEVFPNLSSHRFFGGFAQQLRKKVLRKKKVVRRAARRSSAAVVTAGLRALDSAESIAASLSPHASVASEKMRGVSRRISSSLSRESSNALTDGEGSQHGSDGGGSPGAGRAGSMRPSALSRLGLAAASSAEDRTPEVSIPCPPSPPPPSRPPPPVDASVDGQDLVFPEGDPAMALRHPTVPAGYGPGAVSESREAAPGGTGRRAILRPYNHRRSVMETFMDEEDNAPDDSDVQWLLDDPSLAASCSSAMIDECKKAAEIYHNIPEGTWCSDEIGEWLEWEFGDEAARAAADDDIDVEAGGDDWLMAPGPIVEAFSSVGSPTGQVSMLHRAILSQEISEDGAGPSDGASTSASQPLLPSSSSMESTASGASSPSCESPTTPGIPRSSASFRIKNAPAIDKILNPREHLNLRDRDGVAQNMCCFCEEGEDGRFAIFSERVGMDGVDADDVDGKEGDLYLPGGRGIQIRRHKLKKSENPVKEHYHNNVAFRPVFVRIMTAVRFVETMLLGRGVAHTLTRRGRRLARTLDREKFFRVRLDGGGAAAVAAMGKGSALDCGGGGGSSGAAAGPSVDVKGKGRAEEQ